MINQLENYINFYQELESRKDSLKLLYLVEQLCKEKQNPQLEYCGLTYCVICFQYFEKDSNTYKFQCNHMIHKECAIIYSKKICPELLRQIFYPECLQCNTRWSQIDINKLVGAELQRSENEQNQRLILQLNEEDRLRQLENSRKRNFQCPICLEEKNVDADCFSFFNCDHRCCKSCLLEHVQAKMQEGNFQEENVTCVSCKVPLSPNELEAVLKREDFVKLSDFRIKNLVGQHGYLRCPALIQEVNGQITQQGLNLNLLNNAKNPKHTGQFKECPAIIQISGDIPFPVCPICKIQFCAKGCPTTHVGKTCEKFREETNLANDNLFNLLVQNEKLRMCPQCKAMVQKTQGCNHITCRCKYEYCYVCSAKWRSCAH
ncbi:hypothetical protein pb186bvf_012270 [Paramecium bursaria]